MPKRPDFEAAFAICAAIIGAGFASGREIVSFFSCFGKASFLGAAAASAGIAFLVYVILLLARQTRASSFPALYGALMGQPCQDAISVLHSLLCLITASAMLCAGAELGALTFPLHHSYELGFLLTLTVSIAAVCKGFPMLALMGALLVPLTAGYFFIMALTGRYASSFSLSALLPSIPMGLIYAAFNGALAGGAICLSGQKNAHPCKTALLTGGLLFVLLSCANGAMLRAGNAVMQMTMPAVVLAAQWGAGGYYLSIAVLWLSVLSTLCAMLQTLSGALTNMNLPRPAAILAGAASASLISVCGFRTLVDAVYPLLGWVCGFALVALMLFLPDHQKETK